MLSSTQQLVRNFLLFKRCLLQRSQPVLFAPTSLKLTGFQFTTANLLYSTDGDKPQDKDNTLQKKTKKVQNTVKVKKTNAESLLKKLSRAVHLAENERKQSKQAARDIGGYLKSINKQTEHRKICNKFGQRETIARNEQDNARPRYRGMGRPVSTEEMMERFQQDKNARKYIPSAIDEKKVAEYVDILLNTKERLGIFDCHDSKISPSDKEEKTELGHKTAADWWDEWEAEKAKESAVDHVKSHYQEMLEWAKEGKLPIFPIDNEIGMEHEDNVPFHKHVFLHELIEGRFPKQGPVRKFMEAVILGLSRNPYLTLEEKQEHINWFEEYFNEKAELLKTLGAINTEESLPA